MQAGGGGGGHIWLGPQGAQTPFWQSSPWAQSESAWQTSWQLPPTQTLLGGQAELGPHWFVVLQVYVLGSQVCPLGQS